MLGGPKNDGDSGTKKVAAAGFEPATKGL